MRDTFPFIDILTLPVDAGANDRRIIIDGVDGEIELYDSSGNLRIKIGGSGINEEDRITFYSSDPDESFPGFIRSESGNRHSIFIQGPRITGRNERAELRLSSPSDLDSINRAEVSINGISNDPDLTLLISKITISTGSNRPIGLATLSGGTVTVNHNRITANSRIFLSRETTGGILGHLSYTKIAGTSFTINSSSATETSTVAYLVVN